MSHANVGMVGTTDREAGLMTCIEQNERAGRELRDLVSRLFDRVYFGGPQQAVPAPPGLGPPQPEVQRSPKLSGRVRDATARLNETACVLLQVLEELES